ncbi:MAG: Relaxase/Mobilization nuclease protein [Ferruginibacter sp.]|nr:Relaxase/Mobilization nuclease protein [Ferruginibacter sp.]
MISKPVRANSFYHTCRYIANKQGAEVLLAEGVRGHDYKLMAADFEMQQQLRPSKIQACFHSILSFYPGEKPSDEMMKEIAKKYLTDLGITNTQYAVSKHTDKAHLHMHIVANMVNNDGKAISDSWIGLRGKKIAQQLTEEYKLIPALQKNLKLTNMEALSQTEANKYRIYIAIAENLPGCRSMEELEKKLLMLGIETQYKYKGQTQEKQGVSFKMGDTCFKGSQVDRKFSFAGLEKTLQLQRIQVLEQQPTEQQKRAVRDVNRHQKTIFRKEIPANILQVSNKELTHNLAKGIEKTIDILLKPELTNEQLPFDLSQAAMRKKKKKKSQRLRQ